MINWNLRRQAIVLLASCLLPAALSASSILYTTFDPAGYHVNGGYNTSGFNGTTFKTTGGGNLSTVSLAVAVNQSSPASLTLGLYADSSGRPAALLESWTSTFPGANNPPITILLSSQHPALASGAQYWLIAQPASAGVIWVFNNQGVPGGLWVGLGLAGMSQVFASYPEPAIQLDAFDSVPEPVSGNLVGLGCLALMGLHATCKRRSIL